jgi:L-2-amino-thiazoline-4-carboxylic acid hydrolase
MAEDLTGNEWFTETAWFTGGIWSTVAASLPEGAQGEISVIAIAGHIAAANQHRVADEASAVHVKMCSYVLSCYKQLRSHLDESASLAVLRRAMVEPFKASVGDATQAMLASAEDPMVAMRESSKAKEREYYGSTFEFSRPTDDNDGYVLVVNRCFYADFCTGNGAPELTHVWCEFDTSWMSEVQPEVHGFIAERPVTIGYGADHCTFSLLRTSTARSDH